MALHIRDPEVDQLATELAELRKSTKTEAVKHALKRELAMEKRKPSLWERIKPIRDRLAAFPDTGVALDKAFFDDLNGEDER